MLKHEDANLPINVLETVRVSECPRAVRPRHPKPILLRAPVYPFYEGMVWCTQTAITLFLKDSRKWRLFFHSKRINKTSSPESIQISPETSEKNPRIPYVNKAQISDRYNPSRSPTGLGTYRQMLDFTQAEGP